MRRAVAASIALLFVFSFLSCSQPTPSSAFQPGEGWVPLFNGKDLSGWKLVGRYPPDWHVEDGVYYTPTASDSIYT
ncbi:MAG: family 16 glycoside hydrolase, partial [Planctomycetota bacterium]